MASVMFIGATGRLAYPGIVLGVVEGGYGRRARGLNTVDLGPTLIELESPYNALPVGVGRGLNRRIAAAEAVQLIGAFSDPELLFKASPNFRQYAEDDGRFHGAYGTRIRRQLVQVYEKLTRDPGTRQAVITLWDPRLDNNEGKRDYPCTLSLVFSRGPKGFLELDVTMRSNDVWRGLPYDMFQFTQLQLTLARALGWEPGPYRHHALSLHLYETDLEAASWVTTRLGQGLPPSFVEEQPTGFGPKPGQLAMAMARAQSVPYDVDMPSPDHLTESEAWYWHVLRGHNPELVRTDGVQTL